MFLRKKVKRKFIRKCKGMISIFLCIIMTPILSLASALVEYSRNQSAVDISVEAINVSTLSTLSNYDAFLNDRFGLMAVSQDLNLKNTYKKYLDENFNILGKAISSDIKSVNGKLPLTDIEVLEQQLIDYGECTALIDTALEDFNLEELVEKLNNSSGLTALADTTKKISELATFVEEAVDTAETLRKDFDSAFTLGNSILQSMGTISTEVQSLNENIKDDIDEIITDDNGNRVVVFKRENSEIVEDYKSSLEIIFNEIKNIQNNKNQFQTSINNISKDAGTLKTKIGEAKNKLNEIGTKKEKKSEDKGENVVENGANDLTSVFDTMLDQLSQAVTNSLNVATDTAKNAIQNALNNAVAQFKDIIGINDTVEKFESLQSDNIFELLCSIVKGEFKENIIDLLESVELNIHNIGDLKTNTKSIIDEVYEKFNEQMKSGLTDVLQNLADTITSLFDMSVFYDGNLCAYLSNDAISGLADPNSPYDEFLKALSTLVSGIDEIKNSGNKKGIVAKVKAAIKGLKDVLSSVDDVVSAFKKSIENLANKISELAGYLTGDIEGLYKQFIVAANIAHSLPCRTNYNDQDATSLSGYKYADIPLLPEKGTNQTVSGFKSLIDFFENGVTGQSTDNMFCGCELEYVLIGSRSEMVNQIFTFFDIYILRLALDIAPIFMNSEIRNMASAANVFSWVVYILEILAEPMCDTILLVNGSEVPIIKGFTNGCYLTPTGIPVLLDKIKDFAIKNTVVKNSFKEAIKNMQTKLKESKYSIGAGFQNGWVQWKYENYVSLYILLLNTQENTLKRFSNIVQLEAGKYYSNQGKSFDISKAYTAVNSKVEITYKAFLPVLSMDNRKITINKCRGY